MRIHPLTEFVGVYPDEYQTNTAIGDVTDQVMGKPWVWRTPGWGGDRPTVLAFDPGATTGWALIEGSKYSGGSRVWEARWVRNLIDSSNADLIVCEDAFASKNIASAFSLCRRVGAVIALAELAGLCVARVSPPTWQSSMLGGKNEREAGKALSLAVARRRVSGDIRDDHQADAALLALWARGV